MEADLNLCRSTPATRHLKYRNIKAIDPVRFAALIRDQEIFTSPPDDVNAFADMLDASVMRVLDVLAPMRKHERYATVSVQVAVDKRNFCQAQTTTFRATLEKDAC